MVNQPGLMDNPELGMSINVAEAIGNKIDDKLSRLSFFSKAANDMLNGRKVNYIPEDLMAVLNRMPITTYGGDSPRLWDILTTI
jgi:hypothetical protein